MGGHQSLVEVLTLLLRLLHFDSVPVGSDVLKLLLAVLLLAEENSRLGIVTRKEVTRCVNRTEPRRKV